MNSTPDPDAINAKNILMPPWPQLESAELIGAALDTLASAHSASSIWAAYERQEAQEKAQKKAQELYETQGGAPYTASKGALADALWARPAFWMAVPGDDLASHPLRHALRDGPLFDLFVKANPSRALNLLTILGSDNPMGSAMALASDPASALGSLIEIGADPLAPSASNDTPLHVVCQRPFTKQAMEAAGLLIALGADPKAINDDGASAIHMAAASWPWAEMAKRLSAEPSDLLGIGGIDGAIIAIEETPPLISILLDEILDAARLARGEEFVPETQASFAAREQRTHEIVKMALCPERTNNSLLLLLNSAACRGQAKIFKSLLDELAARGEPPPGPEIFLLAIGRLIPTESYQYSPSLESGRLECMEHAVAAGVDLAREIKDRSRATTLFASVADIANGRNFIMGGKTAQFEEIVGQRGSAILRLGGAGRDDQSISALRQKIDAVEGRWGLGADDLDKIKNIWISALEREALSLAASKAQDPSPSTPRVPRL